MPRPKVPFTFWRIAIFIALLLPLVTLVYGFITSGLGANPVETLTHETGKWAFIALLLSLSISPASKLLGLKTLMQVRRMLGLYCFFYACLHVLIYWVFDQSLSLAYVWEDIVDRPYITVGFAAWCLLLPLAITSTRSWRRKLGKNWLKLHKLVYAIALLALVHYVWMIRADYAEVIWYGVYLCLLFLFRFISLTVRRKTPV